jgi:hypothetical protein
VSPNSREQTQKAHCIIANINKINLQSIKKQPVPKWKKAKPDAITLLKKQDGSKMKFKVFAEDDLGWPVDSYLIQNIQRVPPKHGGGKRISMEQDYSSDKEIVNSAKQKNKRELKAAIDEFLERAKN